MAEAAAELLLVPDEELILASGSPRRRQLLKAAGIKFSWQTADVDETSRPGETAAELVQRLATSKARQVAAACPGRLVLGADTAVVLEEVVYGKPNDMDEARAMLQALSGRTHQVLTGVCLIRQLPKHEEVSRSWACTTRVTFRTLTADDIKAYFRLVDPLDKAGAYGIQEHGDMIVEQVDGLLSNVIGLPIEELFPSCRASGMN
ncbi:MAG TPA: Maf family protein [Lentisphaeria bacterium]|nr:Maf family protein [Lentisphaeria bacterium]